ncbi:S-methylmethionine--homocysteine S-methyltransferase BHMT2-like [Gigantopelta aegis]|uniref:S-methylmethionine--homocysteine S-methyltransferase BHMT2-like n=1 Tax=Gigantopelta aegis TaxID=1735272 RepID=UPI001B88A6E2|nr:S-methylmethionine--homocysteine S-methyltransferase BHMT2-like [Gigantopelta aegis]
MQSINDPVTGVMAFPVDLPAYACSRTQIREFAEEAKSIGIQYVGLCCGNASHYLRVIAEVYGHKPPASRYAPDMSQHYIYGTPSGHSKYYTQELKKNLNCNGLTKEMN